MLWDSLPKPGRVWDAGMGPMGKAAQGPMPFAAYLGVPLTLRPGPGGVPNLLLQNLAYEEG
ncbi:hypothetical protein [uncultured Thermus sp.]|uniref:hypothetical protein n=1 Tax=uncultured Thermus sp. TaxID=157149 RepID=UPI00261B0FC7|nr:hypothetical protein [uncultured Thermus sp.]